MCSDQRFLWGKVAGVRSFGLLFAIFLALILNVSAVRAQTDGQIAVGQSDSDWIEKAQTLSNALASDSVEKKRTALFEIRSLRTSRASELAIPSLTDLDEVVRATAAGSVVFLDRQTAARVLIPLLKDRAAFVRREASFALGKVGSSEATLPLVNLLKKDGNSSVRAATALAIGEIGDPVAIAALTAVLKKYRSANEFVVRSSAHSVGQIAQKLRFGTTTALTPDSFLPDKYLPFTDEKADDLKLIEFRTTVQILMKILSDKRSTGDIRREAAFALGSIGASEATSILEANLSSNDTYLARICREALLKIPKTE